MNEEIFNVGDTVKHRYTNEVLEISELGTGNGKVSIDCVDATKLQWEIVNKNTK